MYWFFAHCFNFSPEQVDSLPYDRMVYMMELEKEKMSLDKTNLGK